MRNLSDCMNRLLILPVLLLTLLVGTPAFSGDFQKGYTAYRTGDYGTALRLWGPLAKQGNPLAQFNLGFMYEKGDGVPQNIKIAMKWYKLSAAKAGERYYIMKGEMCEKGTTNPRFPKCRRPNYVEAAKNYREGAERGHSRAMVEAENLSDKILKDLAAKKARKAAGKTSYSYSEKQELVAKEISIKYLNFRTYKLLCRKDRAGIIPLTKKYMNLMRKLHAKVLGPHAEGKKWSEFKDRAFELSNPLVEDWKKDSGFLLAMHASLSEDKLRQPCSSGGKLGNIIVSPLRMENSLIQQKINKTSGKKEKRAF